ncbi:hypothetical protein ACFSTH_03840 [Paenibacillus yanchengensis]|uniref:Preprotein translocase subunit Tim44 n=1 Tax=Paenibacillus yanchengensis TaxID=2035833 RepID=A0ABW4YJP8_9BACL
MKKGMLVMMVMTLLLTIGLSFSENADARRGGGFRSPKSSFTQTPKKTDSVKKSNPKQNQAGATANKPNSGGFMRGMLFGGLAGMLFGGLFAGMGGFGQILSLLVNIIIFAAIIMAVRALFIYIRNNRKQPPNPYNPNDRRNY